MYRYVTLISPRCSCHNIWIHEHVLPTKLGPSCPFLPWKAKETTFLGLRTVIAPVREAEYHGCFGCSRSTKSGCHRMQMTGSTLKRDFGTLLTRAGLLCCNFLGQPGSVSKFPPLFWVKLWVGWVGRGYTEISRYFPASWINWVTLVTKKKLLYSLRF